MTRKRPKFDASYLRRHDPTRKPTWRYDKVMRRLAADRPLHPKSDDADMHLLRQYLIQKARLERRGADQEDLKEETFCEIPVHLGRRIHIQLQERQSNTLPHGSQYPGTATVGRDRKAESAGDHHLPVVRENLLQRVRSYPREGLHSLPGVGTGFHGWAGFEIHGDGVQVLRLLCRPTRT